MKSNIIVIFACPELYNDLFYTGKLLEYENGPKIEYVEFYFCGAKDKENVISFIKSLPVPSEPSLAEKFGDLLTLAEITRAVPIDENLKMFIARQMFRLDTNTWKCAPATIDSDRYLVLPVPATL